MYKGNFGIGLIYKSGTTHRNILQHPSAPLEEHRSAPNDTPLPARRNSHLRLQCRHILSRSFMTFRQLYSNLPTFTPANSLCLKCPHPCYPHVQVQLIFHSKFESPLNLKLI